MNLFNRILVKLGWKKVKEEPKKEEPLLNDYLDTRHRVSVKPITTNNFGSTVKNPVTINRPSKQEHSKPTTTVVHNTVYVNEDDGIVDDVLTGVAIATLVSAFDSDPATIFTTSSSDDWSGGGGGFSGGGASDDF